MNYNLLAKWLELKNEYPRLLLRENFLKDWVKSQCKDNIQGRTWSRWGRDYQFAQKKALFKEIGEKVAEFLADNQNSSGFAEWANSRSDILHSSVSLTNILEEVFDDSSWVRCEDCEVIEHYDDARYCYNDYYVCSSCADNYVWSEYRETYITEDDYADEEDEEDDPEYENIGSYHSSKRYLGHIPSAYDNRKPRVLLGLELEMEANRSSVGDLDERAEHLLDSIAWATDTKGNRTRYCALEQDGSLDYGFEMVTGYTGLDVHQEQLKFFKNTFEGMRSHDTKTCGLHIHICKSDMSIYHAMKMVLFINDTGNANLVRSLARRDASSYAKFKDKKGDTSWYKDASRARASKTDKLRCLNADRYEALNFQNEKTIEFRLFKGTLKYETIMACLEFTYATWFFCRDTSAYDLTSEKFLEFIQKPQNKGDTKFLRAYLMEKGFIPEKCPRHDLAVEAV